MNGDMEDYKEGRRRGERERERECYTANMSS